MKNGSTICFVLFFFHFVFLNELTYSLNFVNVQNSTDIFLLNYYYDFVFLLQVPVVQVLRCHC